MNHYGLEDQAWERLKDVQREAETRQARSADGLGSFASAIKLLGKRIWYVGGLAIRRPPRRHPNRTGMRRRA